MDIEVVNRSRTFLPRHGPITCRDCWESCAENVKEQVTSDGKFRLVNDPGSWGSSDPEILILGISKGNTQAREFAHGEFDLAAWKNCRPRLRDSLSAVGLMDASEDISNRMKVGEKNLSFGSVVRCSVTGLKNGTWSVGTPEVIPAFSHSLAGKWLQNCFKRHLSKLPERLRIIALTGNNDRWIKTVSKSVKFHYPSDFQQINDVAYRAGGKLWVHIGHPSPGNGHFKNFINGTRDQTQGRKRILARSAIVDQ